MLRHRYLAPRLFLDRALAAGTRVALPQAAAHHAIQVLRLREGEPVVVFNGRGGEYAATLVAESRNSATVEIGEFHPIERESPVEVVLVQGLSSGERMDLTVQKSVELGVHAIRPVAAEKSVVHLTGERAAARRTHWQRIAIAACEQCGRNRVPEILALKPLASAAVADGVKLVLAPDARDRLRDALAGAPRRVSLAVGPEAGFSESEERQLVAAGYRPVMLGPRILRTETAAPAALAAINALAGDF